MKKVSQKEYDNLLADLENAKMALENVEVVSWWDTNDKLTLKTNYDKLESLSLLSNTRTWKDSIDSYDNPLYIEIYDDKLKVTVGTSVSWSDIHVIINYLCDKIEYRKNKGE